VSRIDDYRQVAPQGAVDMILKLADRVRGRRFLNVTGGRLGGGAAEILREAVPILSDLGVDTSWEITGAIPPTMRPRARFRRRSRARSVCSATKASPAGSR